MKKIFVYLFLISTCFSCKKWSKIYGISGNVIAKFTKLNDSISFGIYYNNESVKEKELFIKNLMYHGEAKYFYSNGKLKQ
jgi:antitoxin component YwqK of YwqJK toxin-antitoxin module